MNETKDAPAQDSQLRSQSQVYSTVAIVAMTLLYFIVTPLEHFNAKDGMMLAFLVSLGVQAGMAHRRIDALIARLEKGGALRP